MATASAPGTSPTRAQGGFVRKASGLVRDFSQLDNWIYNVLAINIVLNVALSYALVATTYPRASIWLSLVIAGVFCTFEAVVYAFFCTAMPRSGGDYVFQSRVLGGGVATIFAFAAVTLSQIVWMAVAGYFGATVVFSPFLTLLGAAYHEHWLISVGAWFLKPVAIFVMGVICTVWAVWINILGLRIYALWQRYWFWAGMVALAVVMVVLLFSSKADFIGNFNGFMAKNYHLHNAYQTTIVRGGHAPSTAFSFGDTVLAAVIASFALIYPAWGVQQAGEIKRANSLRSNMWSIVGAEVFSFIVVAILGALLVSRIGENFLYAAGSIQTATNNTLPVAPFFGFFAALVGGSTFFIWISFIVFVAWFWMWFPNIVLGGTRVMIAMSFDKILPEWIGKVNRRTHTPINAILTFAVVCIGVSALYAFIHSFVKVTLGLLILNITGFAATMIAAALFPYLKRDMYNATPIAKYKFAGVPVITLCALVFLAFVVFVDVQAFRAKELGLNGTPGLVFIGGTYVIAALVYVISKTYRKRKDNLDLSIVYQELPAE